MKYLCNDEDRVLDGVVDLDMALEMPFIVAEITLKAKNKNIFNYTKSGSELLLCLGLV